MRHRAFALVLTLLLYVPFARADNARIHVDARQVIAHVTPWTTGACIEDVNHEVYGGIYSQMIFGESFQEPPTTNAPGGFTAYGGEWRVERGELVAGAGDGPKLVLDEPVISRGEASVEVLLPDNSGGNAALIVKVDRPRPGADDWIGYEIGLDAAQGALVIGRHRHNWEPIRTVPCAIPVNQWIKLTVRMTERTLQVLVDGKSLMTYEDRQHPLQSGKIGLRTWRRSARYRNLTIREDGGVRPVAFEQPADVWPGQVSGMWRPFARGSASGTSSLVSDHPFIGAQSQRLTFDKGKGEVGIENRGLNRWGMNFVANKPYEGYVWARAEQPMKLVASMESADGSKVYAENALRVDPGDWRRIEFSLTPSAGDASGRFALKLKHPGSVLLGHAFLQPGEWGRFKGLPVRKDVAEALVAQGLTVLRYGGSMVNAPEYQWKKMIGPRGRRPPYHGTWYPYSSNGWGIIDFLSFCEAAGFQSVPAFNMDETPGDMADFVEYVNGPADSKWGRRRAEDGHPKTFKLKYLELGNEEAVNETYWKKFKPLMEAIWAKDPAITPVVGDFAYGQHIADPYHFGGAPRITSLAAHKQILDFAAEQHKPVWFDVHINNDNPRDPERQIDVIGELAGWLTKISPGAHFKICVFEENANNHAMRRALGHARAINGLERLGDIVPIVCCANCLQCDGQNDNGWDQGLLFLNPHKVWPQPPYFVTQMISKNYLPKCVRADVTGAEGLDVTARISDDGRVLTLQVMNPGPRETAAQIQLDGFTPPSPSAHVAQLSGELNAVNTAQNPTNIAPVERKWPAKFENRTATYTFPPQSFTLLRVE